MAVTKGSYYADEGPEIPVPPGYSAPDPHAAKVSQRPFEAPSTSAAANAGTGTSTELTIKASTPGKSASAAQNTANAAFYGAADATT